MHPVLNAVQDCHVQCIQPLQQQICVYTCTSRLASEREVQRLLCSALPCFLPPLVELNNQCWRRS